MKDVETDSGQNDLPKVQHEQTRPFYVLRAIFDCSTQHLNGNKQVSKSVDLYARTF